ncbi:putative DNA-binding domain-containing protein [Salipiger sp.]|uniref:HvfC/BufC family peptide modification chaperone n=1 Tax=Salipiger sp. TaxID=2078585 RepID=UPI003A980116
MTPRAFHAALLDPARPVPEGLTDGAGAPAGRRFAVYRNNVAVSLTEALETGFPVVRALLGEGNFARVAGLFLRRHPPESPLMMRYGAAFPAFLAGLEALEGMGYLPDCARLDLAMRRSYHAADARPVDAAELMTPDGTALAGLRIALAPAAILLRSPWPIHALRRLALEPGAPPPPAEAQDVLILRPDYDPAPHLLPPGGGAFVAALRDGKDFGTALDRAGDGFDPAACLSLLLAGRAITALIPKDR